MAAIAADFLGDRSELSEHPSAAPRSTLGYDSEPLPPPRARLRTLDYSEPRDAPRTPPPVGRQTLEAIDSELTRWARSPTEGKQPPAPQPTAAIDGFEVHEMITFVVRGDVTRLASAAARRDFVRDYLLRRLPARSMDGVDRIDVTPWTVRGTVVVRVWCRVG